MSKNYLQKISDTHWLVANDLEGKNIQLYYVNLFDFDKNIVLGRMLAVSYLNLAHTHYAYWIITYCIYLLFMICMLSLHLESF